MNKWSTSWGVDGSLSVADGGNAVGQFDYAAGIRTMPGSKCIQHRCVMPRFTSPKLAVILTLVVAFFVLFNVGMVVSALVPPLVLRMFRFRMQMGYFLKENAYYFWICLPVWRYSI